MPIPELAIWFTMLGGMLMLLALAVGDGIAHRSSGSLRNVLFILVTGSSCVVITGLPEAVFPGLPQPPMRVLKACLGPGAGAMALYFLGDWLSGPHEDRQVHRLTHWGGAVLALLAMALALRASQIDAEAFQALLWWVAAANMVPAVLALIAVVRSAVLGDPLARWMVIAIVCLDLMVAGLYTKALGVQAGTLFWLLTATITLAYFLIVTVLVLLRHREIRLLKRLLRLELGAEPATGLPTGPALLSQIEHAFWRSARLNASCSVICLYLSNLYEVAGCEDHKIDGQILVTLAARIRQAAGFRCTVGLYHPRCFVVVMSSDGHHNAIDAVVGHLLELAGRPLAVTGEWQSKLCFVPQVGVGVVTVDPATAQPLEALNQAEQMALLSVRPTSSASSASTSSNPFQPAVQP
ncbi:GGDEF domain-containing protein [Hydrogenophaga sp. PAMC20947]|uniref:GGDEF domain-containing protein n=1 Tax=Hydrogenophaga sp. PAMC20947 TaxID=2565558 RepID=UPI00109DBE44|nr:GGDEF domain-containing protein [Hydrogenophaga sp. PAMC20947]QCB44817.1 GGDEF domain-containing protein [Hydrogenophaga sp. PAMC20947]